MAVVALPDGRVVTGSDHDGQVLVWNPDELDTGPVELGHEGAPVRAVAVPLDGRAVSSGYDYQVRLRNVQGSSPGTLIACYAYALATSPSTSGTRLFIGDAAM